LAASLVSAGSLARGWKKAWAGAMLFLLRIFNSICNKNRLYAHEQNIVSYLIEKMQHAFY
jgi:hypothetical protein